MNKLLVITVALMAAALTGISATSTTPAYAGGDHVDDNYGDSSGTNTDQKLVQENIGSGFSININCAQNLISSVSVVCFDPTVNSTDDG
jgi:hypothetical protein